MFLSIGLCLVLGIWWLYLLYKFAHLLQTYAPSHTSTNSLYLMIISEGSTFFVLLIVVIVSTFFLLRKEQRKYQSLQQFYAIFSHELKTPLTTMQLQLEVLPKTIKNIPIDHQKVDTIINRLQSSSIQLKYEVEKMLTLSQLELAPKFELESIDLLKYFSHWLKNQSIEENKINIDYSPGLNTIIQGNQNALDAVFNNLIRNTIKHAQDHARVELKIMKTSEDKLQVSYCDYGEVSNMDGVKLGELFYKSDNSSGSGLGLFIIKQMMMIMNGSVNFDISSGVLVVHLFFKLDT